MTKTADQAYEEIRAHHRVLGEQLSERARAVSTAVAAGRPCAAAIGGFVGYLAGEVLPHAAAEERTIYPLAAAHAGLAGLVEQMSAEHFTLSAAGYQLAVLADCRAAAGQTRQIAELFAAHTVRENEVLLPALLADNSVDLVTVLGEIHAGAHQPGGGPMTKGTQIRLRRVYEPVSAEDGFRVLVDRVWPRGLRKDAAHLDEWAKDVAPSAELRVWYRHDPARFDEFRRRYAAELAEPGRSAALSRLRARADEGPLTLLTATRELNLSQAAVLADLIADT